MKTCFELIYHRNEQLNGRVVDKGEKFLPLNTLYAIYLHTRVKPFNARYKMQDAEYRVLCIFLFIRYHVIVFPRKPI
jgi:hypothetical protein